MKLVWSSAIGCLFGIACAGGASESKVSSSPADVIVVGAAVHTMAAQAPTAQAIAVRSGEIVYVGDAAGAQGLRGPRTSVLRLPGYSVLPGFHDSHVHPVTGGVELGQCDLNDADSEEEVLEVIRRYAADHPDREWVVGGGWALPLFPSAGPSKDRLDAVVSDRPAYLSAADGHSAWVNSAALRRANIDAQTPDPVDGRIERDESGQPTGTLREGAMHLVAKHIPDVSPAEYDTGLRAAQAMANRFGITSVVEASAGPEILAAYRRLESSGELTVRVLAAQRIAPRGGVAQIEDARRRAAELAGPLVRAGMVKIFVDGVIEAKTAALLEPYVGSDSRGVANLEYPQLEELAVAADRAGLDLHFHAIGDRAIRWSLDAVEAAETANGKRDRRPTIAHIQLFDPADVGRFARLGVMANFQPLWAYADSYITDLTIPVLGPERSRWLYPIASVIHRGARVVAGSDWSVSSMNPLAAIQVGMTRLGVGKSGAPFVPQERATLDELLRAYTVNGAYLQRHEQLTGTLEVGKRADLVVLDRDLYRIEPGDIHRAKVAMTVLDGRVVYCSADLAKQQEGLCP